MMSDMTAITSRSRSTQSTALSSTAMEAIHHRTTHASLTPEQELMRRTIPKLASRSCHLPGNGLCQDWLQFMYNNHPVLGICCHHRWHPLSMRQRLLNLLGSFAFGMAITNIIYLWFLTTGRDDDAQIFAINVSFVSQSTTDNALQNTSKVASEVSSEVSPDMSSSFVVTHGLLVLITFGSSLHALFNRFLWSLSACSCCLPGGRFESSFITSACKDVGGYLVVLIVILVVLLATLVVILRASMDQQHQQHQQQQQHISIVRNRTVDFSEILELQVSNVKDLSFVKGYAIEFFVSLFVFYPLFETILFSGILGCFRLPLLGGWPREIYLENELQEKKSSSAAQSVAISYASHNPHHHRHHHDDDLHSMGY